MGDIVRWSANCQQLRYFCPAKPTCNRFVQDALCRKGDNTNMTNTKNFTPALGNHGLTKAYDKIIAVMTREQLWRSRLLEALAPVGGETILDMGSGTGSLACLMKSLAPQSSIIALDPDPSVRKIAEAKAKSKNLKIQFLTALGETDVAALKSATIDKITISLVLHQCSAAAKTGILANAFDYLKPGSIIWIADYGEQKGLLMKLLFNQVRSLDGFENTKANKDGMIPEMMTAAGFVDVREKDVTYTPTGSISLFSGRKPRIASV